jgi:hypothetical protein
MGLCIAAFHWQPCHFWSATPHEVFSAYEVWHEMNSVEDD